MCNLRHWSEIVALNFYILSGFLSKVHITHAKRVLTGVIQFCPETCFPLLNYEHFPSLSNILLNTFFISASIPFYKVSNLIYPTF